MTLRETADAGDELATLEALRGFLADAIVSVEPHHAAPLVARFDAVLARIAILNKASKPTEGTTLDEFTKRRQGKAKSPSRPPVNNKRG